MTRAAFTTYRARWALLSRRAPLLVLAALLIVACGREAPPRAASPTTASPTRARISAIPPTQATDPASTAVPPGDDTRAQGDPNAPITVIEYGDYQ